MANNTNPAAQGGQVFREGVQRMTDDASRIKQDLSAMGQTLAETARSGAALAKETVQHGVDRAREQGEEFTEVLCDKIAERPLMSVAVAAGVGMVLGLILFRPRE